MKIPFGEWLPDFPDLGNPGATVATNVLPTAAGYEPFLSPVIYSTALTARCQGAFSAIDKDGNARNYAGDATKLYRMASQTYTDASATTYSLAATDFWQFDKYGEDIIATNIADNPQYITMGGASFANLTTTLKARCIGVVRDFVVFGNTYDSVDGFVPFRLWWSAKGNSADYTPADATFSGSVDLAGEGGWIYRVIGGDTGVVFQESVISIMTFNGVPGETFQVDIAETGRGTRSPMSVVRVGRMIFYLGIDGFYVFDRDTRASTPIGHGKVDRYFQDDVIDSYLYRISAAADPVRKIVAWSYPGAGSTNGTPNKILMFNWGSNRWSIVEQETEIIAQSISEGYTLEGLDALGYTLDTLPYSLDSRVWSGGNLLFSGFNTSHKLVNYTGTALDAVLETTEFEPAPGRKSTVNSVRSIIDGGTTTLKMATRNNQADTYSYGGTISPTTFGRFSPRSTGRYHRIKATITGGFTDAVGLDVEAVQRGKR